ncbi:hypothetical protein DFR41_101594 [Pseudacidovorax intermedius]|uniref:Carboxypeptidase family protein n=1 Tax=Pseudacidovorax intermedius TaxID=433924 RepID=A0A370FSU8_9BURK|nr:hypothetical protein [Pseudacidovorax intermedius]RDI28838.1 hypothetical protein DFR41_101594 [Pseudacidovorax intermedius]
MNTPTLDRSIARPLSNPMVAVGNLMAASLLAVVAGAAHASTTYNPPIEMTKAGIEYMSGGTTPDEAKLMKVVEPRWPASFEFDAKGQGSVPTGAPVKVTVRDAGSGAVVLNDVTAGGPYMVARLDPGRYQVTATRDGQTVSRDIEVGRYTTAHAVFDWSGGTGVASSR